MRSTIMIFIQKKKKILIKLKIKDRTKGIVLVELS